MPAARFLIRGASGACRIRILDRDAAGGVVASIVLGPPGGRIPAHRHPAGPGVHGVPEGDLIDRGERLGPGSFLTHAAGVVHGPHETTGGARVLMVRHRQSTGGDSDVEPAADAVQRGPGGGHG